jgi:hypothetical protein
MLEIYADTENISQDMESFTSDSLQISIPVGGALEIGYYKPINSMWLEITPNAIAKNFVLKYFNGSTFVEIPEAVDTTKDLKRSGWIKWNRNLSNESKTTLHGKSLYWYKLELESSADDPTIIEFEGINLVFSNDDDLSEEFPGISDLLPEGQASFINFHQAARKDIITHFRNQGKFVGSSSPKNIDQWDLLDFTEVREASKFLVLSKIMQWRSDATDDKFYQKHQDYLAKYGEKINLAFLSLDSNDDGQEEPAEKTAINIMSVQRL